MQRIDEGLADAEVLDLEGAAHPLRELWASRPAVVVFIRHFSCIFCREQVAQLRPELPAIRGLGAELQLVGNGTVEQLRWFVEDQRPDFPVFTDPTVKVYEAAGFRRDKGAMLHLGSVKSAARAAIRGFRQDGIRGDRLQQGGVLVVLPDGRLAYRYVSNHLGDHPSPDSIVSALRAALRAQAQDPNATTGG